MFYEVTTLTDITRSYYIHTMRSISDKPFIHEINSRSYENYRTMCCLQLFRTSIPISVGLLLRVYVTQTQLRKLCVDQMIYDILGQGQMNPTEKNFNTVNTLIP